MESVYLKNQWFIMHSAIQGFTHMQQKSVKQDYVDHFVIPGKALIAALADGHGAKSCFRSHQGSRFAVQSAINMSSHFISKSYSLPDLDVANILKNEFPTRVTISWKNAVINDLNINPISFLSAEDTDSTSSMFLPYGSTIASIILTDTYLYIMQLGDSDTIFFEQDGSITRPLRKLKTCGDEVHSLCQSDSIKYITQYIRRAPDRFPSAILISSDGYFNSFSDSLDYEKVLIDLVNLIVNGKKDLIVSNFSSWLHETSKSGSGDDISAIFIVNINDFSSGGDNESFT